jgi:hypothetical protein
MSKKVVRQKPGREWIGGRCRLPAYIENPEPVRPDMIVWMDQDSRFVFVIEAVLPETPDSALLDRFHKAVNHPRVGASRRPARLRVAESRWAELLRAGLGNRFEIRVGPTPEIDEVIRQFIDDVNPGVKPSYFGHRLSPAMVDRLFSAAADLYNTSPWNAIGGEDHLLLLDAPRFGLIGASISVIGALGERRGLLVYESLASYEAMARQAERFDKTPPRRSEICTPAMSVTFNRAADLPPQMVREARENGWRPAVPDAYPLVLAFDPDNVARPLRERDCELATACCLAVGRLVARLTGGGPIVPASAQESVVVETLPGNPVVTVALPLPDLYGLKAPKDSSPPS